MLSRSTVVLLASTASLLLAAPAAHAAKPRRGPIDAKVTVDAGRTASVKLTPTTGGKLALKARNGTRVVVSFPAGAVAQDTTVSGAPVTKLSSRVTRKGLLTGIRLQPEGLQLLKPATVAFTRRAKSPKRTHMVFVGSQGGGKGLYRLPPPVRVKGTGKKRRYVPTGRPVVSILHFSTVDAFDWSTATLAELDAILYPELGVDRISQELSKLFLDPNATEQDVIDAYERARRRFIDPLVQTALKALNTTCSVGAIRKAITTTNIALRFQRQLQLASIHSKLLDDASVIPLLASMITATGTCMVTLCPQAGDPRIGTYFVALARELQITGGANAAFISALVENMERCGAFEVRIDSRIDTNGADANWSFRVTGEAKVLPSASAFGDNRLVVRGPLRYVATSGSAPSFCVVTAVSSTAEGQFQLEEAHFSDFNPEKPDPNPVISLRISVPAPPVETYHSTPTGAENCGTTQLPDYPFSMWFAGFQAEHFDMTFPGADFVRDAPPVFALAVYSPRVIDLGSGTISENTKIEIVHTPLDPVPLPSPD